MGSIGPFQRIDNKNTKEMHALNTNLIVALYGSWEALVVCKILLQGTGNDFSEMSLSRVEIIVTPCRGILYFARY